MDFISVTTELLKGFAATCEIFFITLAAALPLGLLFAFFSLSGFRAVRAVMRTIVWVVRGTPLMLQIIAVYYGPALLFGTGMLPRMVAALAAFIFNYACYFSEIFRGGIQSVPRGQYEAGRVLGLAKREVFFKIVLFQVFRQIAAPLSNEVVTLVKDTSLARVIVVTEILKIAQDFSAKGLIWPLFYTGAFYLAFVGILTLLFGRIEKKLNFYQV